MQTLLCKMGHFCQFVVYFRQFVAYVHKKSGSPHIGLPLKNPSLKFIRYSDLM